MNGTDRTTPKSNSCKKAPQQFACWTRAGAASQSSLLDPQPSIDPKRTRKSTHNQSHGSTRLPETKCRLVLGVPPKEKSQPQWQCSRKRKNGASMNREKGRKRPALKSLVGYSG